MPLTGSLTLALVALLAIAAPTLVLTTWNRVGRGTSRPAVARRWLYRAATVLTAQITAVALVGVLVNDSGRFYSSWLQLLGDHHTVTNPDAAHGNEDATVAARLARAAPGHGVVVKLEIPGTESGVGTFPALVYLPAVYAAPAYEHRQFPVVELIAGAPGTPQTWTEALHVAHVLDREIAAGRTSPFIAVMPTQAVDGRRDTQCVNIAPSPKKPHSGVRAETYLTTDVRRAVTTSFRVAAGARSWALMGYSSGGFCATNLAMRHPDLFTAAVSIAGYARPAHDHQTGDLFGKDIASQNLNTPLWRATHLPLPDVSLLLIATNDDPDTARDARAMQAAAHTPMSVSAIVLKHGGHNFEVWRAEEPSAFGWVSRQIEPPLAPLPVIDGTQPTTVGRPN